MTDAPARFDLETFYNTPDAKRFAFPGRVLWGSGSRRQLLGLLADARCVEIYVDGHFQNDPLLDQVSEQVQVRRQVVDSTPVTEAVLAAADSAGALPDVVVALGGGSAIDFAKAVVAKRLHRRHRHGRQAGRAADRRRCAADYCRAADNGRHGRGV